jgi:hypothetical protein
VRQVPDNQECWQDLEGGRLLVVEILERQQVANEQAPAYFFQDLAESNESSVSHFAPQTGTMMPVVAGLPPEAVSCFGTGFQTVALGREFDVGGQPRQQEVRTIRIELCVIRLPSQRTDLLITLSTPSEGNPQAAPAHATETFQQIISSFQIRDWSLFR